MTSLLWTMRIRRKNWASRLRNSATATTSAARRTRKRRTSWRCWTPRHGGRAKPYRAMRPLPARPPRAQSAQRPSVRPCRLGVGRGGLVGPTHGFNKAKAVPAGARPSTRSRSAGVEEGVCGWAGAALHVRQRRRRQGYRQKRADIMAPWKGTCAVGNGANSDFDGRKYKITAAPIESDFFRDQVTLSVWFKRKNPGEDSAIVSALGEVRRHRPGALLRRQRQRDGLQGHRPGCEP